MHGLIIVVEITNTVVLPIFVDFLLKNLHFEVHQVNLLLEIQNHLILVVGDGVRIVAEGSMAYSGRLIHCSCTFFFLACPEHIADRIVIGALKNFSY